jgi:hypothetical protein
MNPSTTPAGCLNCGATDADKPLLLLQLTGSRIHICPQCLPALIHHPDRLTDKLAALYAKQR